MGAGSLSSPAAGRSGGGGESCGCPWGAWGGGAGEERAGKEMREERKGGKSRRGRSVRRKGGRLQPLHGKIWANLLMVCVP